MTKDSKEKGPASSSFRDQILRDLEELKQQRMAEPPAEASLEDLQEELKQLEEKTRATFSTEKPSVEEGNNESVDVEQILPHEIPLPPLPPRKTIKIDEIAFADSNPVEEEPVILDPIPTEEEELVDTVERNLSELRSIAEEMDLQSHQDASVELAETVQITDGQPLVSTSTAEAVEEEPIPVSRRVAKQRRKKQEKTAKRIVTAVVVVVLLSLTITGLAGWFYVKSSLDPINPQATEMVQVEIPEGSSTMEIGQILVDNNLIKNATIFNYYSKIKSYNNFQSGFYNLSQNMSLDELARALQESGTAEAQEPIAGKVLVVEGYTIAQIAEAVTENAHTEDKKDTTPFTKDDFLATVQNPDFINRMVATYPNLLSSLPAADSGVVYQLEGYLFPATYDYTEETTMEGLVEQMIAAMDARLQPYYAELATKGLTVNQLLTMASLVEKEGSTDEDRRNIASVFYNRINAYMPLQSNIAILYAMGKLGQATTLAEDAAIDTAIDSPYNIYVNAGLMPGPVDSPSLSAIEASFNPNKTEYYYFVADVATGTVYFSTTLEEHNQHVETYVNSKLNN